MARHNEKGTEAENIAFEYLKDKSYIIRERNWRFDHKEIDIIAEHEGKLIIIEVKSVMEGNEENASELLTLNKMRNLVDAAEAYIFSLGILKEVRFDFIIVVYGPLGIKLRHVPGAFIPGVNW